MTKHAVLIISSIHPHFRILIQSAHLQQVHEMLIVQYCNTTLYIVRGLIFMNCCPTPAKNHYNLESHTNPFECFGNRFASYATINAAYYIRRHMLLLLLILIGSVGWWFLTTGDHGEFRWGGWMQCNPYAISSCSRNQLLIITALFRQTFISHLRRNIKIELICNSLFVTTLLVKRWLSHASGSSGWGHFPEKVYVWSSM